MAEVMKKNSTNTQLSLRKAEEETILSQLFSKRETLRKADRT